MSDKNALGTQNKRERTLPRTVILDFDRTLISLYQDTGRLRELAGIMGDYYAAFIPVPPEYYDRDGYLAWYDLHRTAKQRCGSESALRINSNAERLVTSFEDEVASRTAFLPGAIRTVRELFDRGFELIVVSNNARGVIEKALSREGVAECFKEIVGRPLPFDPDRIKPDPFQLELALTKTASDRSEACYVGDDYMDVDVAKKCGVLSVGVATGRYTPEELLRRGADYAVASVADLFSLI